MPDLDAGAARASASHAAGQPDAQALAERAVAAMWEADAASRALGMRLEHVGPGTARVSMVVVASMVNGHDLCHGGLIAALADSAFAAACNTYGEVTVAAGFDIAFLVPARLGETLVAEAVERARQGRTGLYDVTVRRSSATADGTDEAVVAEFRGRSRSLGRPIT